MNKANNSLSWLTPRSQFNPPVPEASLKQHSAKLIFSTRLFPEWMTAAYGVLHQRFPGLPVTSASELLALVLQDYISQNFSEIGNTLPTTQQALDFLLQNQFVNPDSKRQFEHLKKASYRAESYKAQLSENATDKELYEFYKTRDPQKAEEILQEMVTAVERGLKEAPAQEMSLRERLGLPKEPEDEEVVTDNRDRTLKSQNSKKQKAEPGAIAGLEFLDQVKTTGSETQD